MVVLKYIKAIAYCGTVFFSVGAWAASQPLDVDRIREIVKQKLPTADIKSIEPAPVSGLYEVSSGTQVYYVTLDGKYFIRGDIFDMDTKTNLTQSKRYAVNKALLDSVSEKQMIVFAPEEVKHGVTVFTDFDCGYCRKLHSEIDQYMQAGIKVRYMMFPRAGKDSESYRKSVAAWCADDRKAALTDAEAGKDIEMKSCENPVDRHMEIAEELGILGTPMIVLENGQVKSGYVSARQLALELDKLAQQ